MKKWVSILCVVAMVCSLAACSKSASGGDGENVTLSWYVPLSAQSDMQTVMDEAAKISEPLIGAKLDIITIDTSAYGERMNMNMAAGTAYDLAFTGYINPYLQAVSFGGLMDITELIDEKAPALKEALPDYAWDAARIDGKIYAVPNLQGFAPPNTLYFRKDLVEKYNFDVDSIEKMEDIEPFLASIKNGEPNMYAYRHSYGTEMWTGGIYEKIQSDVAIRADGSSPEVFYMYDTPEYQQAIATMHDWYKKGYFRQDLLSAGNDSQDVKTGKYAVTQGGWLPGAEVSTAAGNGGHEVIAKSMMNSYLTKEKALATMVAIGANSKNPEKSIQMIELINTNVEFFNLISYGVEGKHYELTEANQVKFIENSGYKPNSAWMFGNQFNAISIEGQEVDVWEKTKKMNDEADTSPLLGFVLDTDPIKNEISQIAAINSEFPLTTFIVNGMESWNTYMEKLDQAGRAKVLEEVQKQVNAYWETK